jgi:hypothetical protein
VHGHQPGRRHLFGPGTDAAQVVRVAQGHDAAAVLLRAGDAQGHGFLPDDLAPRGTVTEKNLYLSLYAGKDDNHYVKIDTTRLRHEEGMLVIPVEADLNTVSPGRMLSLTVNDSIGYTLDMPLQPAPRKEDLAWTERLPMRLSKVSNVKYEYTRVLVRYRVIKKGKPEKG